eukprot:216091-Prorocentrum_minimum.AAC.1
MLMIGGASNGPDRPTLLYARALRCRHRDDNRSIRLHSYFGASLHPPAGAEGVGEATCRRIPVGGVGGVRRAVTGTGGPVENKRYQIPKEEYSHGGPLRRRKRGYIIAADQSGAGSLGIFSRRTNLGGEPHEA